MLHHNLLRSSGGVQIQQNCQKFFPHYYLLLFFDHSLYVSIFSLFLGGSWCIYSSLQQVDLLLPTTICQISNHSLFLLVFVCSLFLLVFVCSAVIKLFHTRLCLSSQSEAKKKDNRTTLFKFWIILCFFWFSFVLLLLLSPCRNEEDGFVCFSSVRIHMYLIHINVPANRCGVFFSNTVPSFFEFHVVVLETNVILYTIMFIITKWSQKKDR